MAILATNEPLPPPPLDTLPAQQTSLAGQPDPPGEQGGVHNGGGGHHQGGGQGGHHQGGGQGGHQRNLHHTGAPTASTPTPVPSRQAGRMPASTPKRESPATIAAKEAPGWQMFLGVKSSTVSFTSEEVFFITVRQNNSFTIKFSGEQVSCDTGFEPDSGTTRREQVAKGGKL